MTERATTGEVLDVDAFVRREAGGVLAYLLRRVEVREDAADLLGETLLVVWRRRAAIPPDRERARMWLYGVARKTLATQRRGRLRRSALASRLRDELSIHTPQADGSLADEVRAAVRQLPELDREIIGLVYWEGFSLEQVARMLKLRPGTIRSRHARARVRLRDLLGEEPTDDL